MAKVIKLKQSDINRIVEGIMREEDPFEFDDFDTKIQPEELPGANTYDEEQAILLQLAQDEQGNYYVLDTENGEPQIVAKTK
jgi:glucose dehydrogenase